VESDNVTMSIDDEDEDGDGGDSDADVSNSMDQSERFDVSDSVAQHLAPYVNLTVLVTACDCVYHLKNN